MIYAIGNDVAWTLRPPQMPPRPWVAASRPTPAIKLDPAKIPLIPADMRTATANGYLPGASPKALAIGRGGVSLRTWSRSSDLAAMRNALEGCGFLAQRPCFIYALGDEVVVRVPESVRIVDVLASDDLVGVSDADRQRIEATYVPDADWRALVVGRNGRMGLGLRQASEQQAIDQAMRGCEQASGLDCTLLAIGPFKVVAR